MEFRISRKTVFGSAALTAATFLLTGANSGCTDQSRESAEASGSDTVALEKIIEASGRTVVGSCLADKDSPYAPEDVSFLSRSEGFGRRNPEVVYVSASDGSSKNVLALEVERDSLFQVSQLSPADADSQEILIEQGCGPK